MFMRRSHARFTSRLVAGLFAVQIVVTGFCLLTSQAHAMPMDQMGASHMSGMMSGADDMSGHCSKSMMHMNGQGHDASHSGGCFHCDEPDQFVKAASADLAPVSLVLACLAMLPEISDVTTATLLSEVQAPTGPPRSSTLLFTTTQRIRV